MNSPTQLTPEQGAIISAYTGFLACPFPVFHEYVERLLGRPVFTHELGNEKMFDKIREASKPDFLFIVPQ